MSEALRQYKALLFTLIANTFSLSKRKNERVNKRGALKKGLGKGATLLLIALGACCILLFIVTASLELTLAALNSGAVEELQYAFIAVTQITVLFFGLATVMSNLYFAKDNAALSALPFKNGVVFSAKFTLSYLGELLFAALIYFPLMITSGIVLILYEYSIDWSYFLVGTINILLIPALPLFIATLLSQPLMWITSRLKRKSIANSIVMGLLYIGFFVIYFAFVMGTSMIGEEGVLSGDMLGLFASLKKITIFNYPLVEALLSRKSALNLLIYIAGVVLALGASVGLSLLMYKKTILRTGEGDGAPSKKIKAGSNEVMPFIRSFIKKDLNVILHTPSLLINLLMIVVLPSVLLFFMSFTFKGDGEMQEIMAESVFISALATYLVSLFMCAGNPMANIGFSLEGKNLYMLKSLPISARELVKAKYVLASSITAVASLILLIVFPFASGVKNAVGIVGVPLHSLAAGLAYNAMGLYNDLKKPNLNWVNLNEITRNNTRAFKPMILFLLLSFGYLIVGIFAGVIGNMLALNETLVLAVYYIICLIAPAIVLYKYLKKLSAPEELFSRIGG